MTRAQLRARILRALANGPLYLGLMPLVVGGADERLIRGAVAELRAEGLVTVSEQGTVTLAAAPSPATTTAPTTEAR